MYKIYYKLDGCIEYDSSVETIKEANKIKKYLESMWNDDGGFEGVIIKYV